MSKSQSDDTDLSRRELLRTTGVAGLTGAVSLASLDRAAAAEVPKEARRFEGRVAVVTGGARGQGRSHAVRLAREGAAVVLCDILEQIPTVDYPMATRADMDETVKLLEAAGGRCLAIKADVRDPKAVTDVVARTLKQFGKIDILLANAGILGNHPLLQISDQAFDDMIRTNLVGVFNCIRAVVPPMKERNYGRIVVTSSQAGRMGYAQLAHYAASKWGVIGLTKSVALEVGLDGITVNAVCPTAVNTPMGSNPEVWRRALPDDPMPTKEKFEALMRQHPSLPQGVPWVEPEEVTEPVLFLASDAARHITGAVIDIQAGAGARNVA
ncbi:MAG TPA: mycofactocin-coupled SDR family oxidoreductase [Alphaproteobacteria bacterium]|nr:mycofactocin-coupled SDR family oxidoreductase [Alphaproteobacteria bacterium]